MFIQLLDRLFRDPRDAGGESGDADGVVAAGLVLVGKKIGLDGLLADGTGAALL
jgi:hypothetical protein